MKIQETYRKSVLSMIFHGSMISCGLVMVSLAFEPAVVSAANVSAVEIKAIKSRLVNVTMKDELMSHFKGPHGAVVNVIIIHLFFSRDFHKCIAA